jgi:hypothetical protein
MGHPKNRRAAEHSDQLPGQLELLERLIPVIPARFTGAKR